MTAGSSSGVPIISSATNGKKNGGGNNDGTSWSSSIRNVTSSQSIWISGVPSFSTLCLQTVAMATITLYILNQKHMLPLQLSRVVSKTLFWPTIPITISRRIGKWSTVVDNAVVLGGAPFGWCGYPERLNKQFNVKGVINMCEEYRGPIRSYQKLGIEHLRLPTVDHFEPSVEDLKKAVSFIQKHEEKGGRVYVHCRAGHGRSAAAVYAWLLYKEPLADPVELNEKLCGLRNVRKALYKQPNINIFRQWLQDGGMMSDSDSEEDDASSWWSRQQNQRFDSDTDDDSDDGVVQQKKFGQVFSSEEESEESSDDLYYDSEISDDEKDYAAWLRNNNRRSLDL